MKTIKKIAFSVLAVLLICMPAKLISAQGVAVDADTKSEVTEFETVTWKDATKKPESSRYEVKLTEDENGKAEYIIPIEIPSKGLLFAIINQPEEQSRLYTYVDLYSDESCTKGIYISPSEHSVKIEKAGTYYFKFSVSDYRDDRDGTCIFGIATCLVSGENVTLKNKVGVLSTVIDSKNPIYYKVTASKQGTLTVNVDGKYSNYITLCNSSKKALTDEISGSSTNNKFVFAVNKGTYYYKVRSYSEVITVKSTFKEVKDASGSTRAKATKLSMSGSKKNGLVLATDKNNKADWFKFYNSKNQKVTVTINGKVPTGEVKIELYDANGKKFSSDYTTLNSYRENASFKPYVARFGATSGSLPKGTYYVKLTKIGKTTTGTYTISVKNK